LVGLSVKWLLAFGNDRGKLRANHVAAEENQDSYMDWRKAVGISDLKALVDRALIELLVNSSAKPSN
jgi:hypothetical protein